MQQSDPVITKYIMSSTKLGDRICHTDQRKVRGLSAVVLREEDKRKRNEMTVLRGRKDNQKFHIVVKLNY